MRPLLRPFLALAAGALLAAAARQPIPNTIEIVVGGGPFAGTYHAVPAEVVCLHAKPQRIYAASWKRFDVHDAKTFAEGGLSVADPDAAGAKVGDVVVTFGADKKATTYTVTRMPLTFTRKGKGAELGFSGKSKEGIPLKVTAKCADVEEI